MKRILYLILTAMVIISLAACGVQSSEKKSADPYYREGQTKFLPEMLNTTDETEAAGGYWISQCIFYSRCEEDRCGTQ